MTPKSKLETSKNVEFAEGGDGHMFGPQAAGPDKPGDTGKDQRPAPGAKFAAAGKEKCLASRPLSPPPPDRLVPGNASAHPGAAQAATRAQAARSGQGRAGSAADQADLDARLRKAPRRCPALPTWACAGPASATVVPNPSG